MATIKQNNINFTNVQASNIYAAGGKFSLSMNDDGTGKFDTTLTGDEISKSLNAVEIDWNGAQLDNVELPVLDNKNTINTTGQLLALINDLQEQINAIVYIMNGGNTGGDEFTSTTTSTSSIIPPQDPGLTSTTTVGPGTTTTITPVTTLR